MKILKRGELPGEQIHRGKCTNCKTEVEFSRKEAKYSADQRDGGLLAVNCPVCSGMIYAHI